MTVEDIRDYCLSLPATTEDMAFGEDYVLFRLFDKIFACIAFERDSNLVVKCDPEYAVELRERYSDIEPAWHWNKKYWIQLPGESSLGADFIKKLVRHSYLQIVKKLPKKAVAEHPEIRIEE